ncbi:Golgin subfamily A [Echinococcus multilocularis]|uniref:Golgin subfamily A n=1 Tax=Echinococcus multilocularis TaxID=6211 RepID=A0A068Y3Z7_ECHMU|nr:Golgin subfamily A [Echinococcus multilocularis]
MNGCNDNVTNGTCSFFITNLPQCPSSEVPVHLPHDVVNTSDQYHSQGFIPLDPSNFVVYNHLSQSANDSNGFSLINEITTSATEKAAQISQELNHLISSNFDYVGHHCQTSSEVANAAFSPLDEVSGRRSDFRTTSHLSLPNSWEGNGFTSPSASSILIRELQQRNVELAALLEQRNEKHDRAVAMMSSLRDQLHRLQLSKEEEKCALEVSTQRELAKARDQVRAHSQTVGALVAEKTELEAKLAHMERAIEARCQEVQSLTSSRNEARAKLREAEDALQLAKSASSHSEAAKDEALRQLEQWRVEAKREKDLQKRLEVEVKTREEKLVRLASDMKQVLLSNEDLRRQLDVAMAFPKSGAAPSPKPGTPAATLVQSKTPSTVPCTRCESLRSRIHDLETTEVHTSAEKARLESQYKAYVADMEMQVANIRIQMEKSNTKAEGLQQTLEDLRRQLTIKESELTDAVSEVERLRTKQAIRGAAAVDAHSTDTKVTAAAVATLESSTERTPLGEAEVKQSVFYKDLELTTDALRNKVNELSERLSETTEALSLAEGRVADREAVLATATSERTALSRAMEQNAVLKDRLIHLQDALDIAKEANKEAEAQLAELRSRVVETHTQRSECEHLKAQIPTPDTKTASTMTSEEESNRKYSEMGAERRTLDEARSKIAELEAQISTLRLNSRAEMEGLEKEVTELRGLSQRQAEHIVALEKAQECSAVAKEKALSEAQSKVTELEAQIESLRRNPLSNKEELEKEVNELRHLSDQQAKQIVALETTQNGNLAEEKALTEAHSKIAELEAQIEGLRTNSTFSLEDQHVKVLEREVTDLRGLSERQAEHIAALEKSLATSKGCEKRDATVDATVRCREVETIALCQTERSLVKSEELLTQLRTDLAQSKASYAQLEERFKQLTDRLVASDEEKSRLEGVVAQLEMESSTIDEYVTMFAHRRQLLLKRAKIRDALLSRLIRDRNELRQRLHSLSDVANAVIASSSPSYSKSEGEQSTNPSMTDFEKALSDFLSHLATSSTDYSLDLNAENNDEDDVNNGTTGNVKAAGYEKIEGASLDDQLRRYVSAVHDCPHCECCSGSLMVV